MGQIKRNLWFVFCVYLSLFVCFNLWSLPHIYVERASIYRWWHMVQILHFNDWLKENEAKIYHFFCYPFTINQAPPLMALAPCLNLCGTMTKLNRSHNVKGSNRLRQEPCRNTKQWRRPHIQFFQSSHDIQQ